MKIGVPAPALAFLLFATIHPLIVNATPLATVQNSELSIPSANLVSAGLPGATNLVGSNFLLSAVMPGTAHGGHAFLSNSQRWVRRYVGSSFNSQNGAYAMLVQRNGRVVVSGYSTQSGSSYDFATVCYAADGTALWTNRYDGPGHGYDTPRLLGEDTNGNVWVVGESMRYGTNYELTDVATIKYASNGAPLWTNRYSSFETNGAYPTALAVDGSGNAYVKQSAAFWTGSVGDPVEDALIKYDPAGNVVWTKHYFVSAPDSGQGLHEIGPMALDDAGNLFVAGESGSAHYSTGVSIVKFTGDGTAVWTNRHSFGSLFGFGFKLLSVDRKGDVIVAGDPYDSGSSSTVYMAMKCSRDGVSLWTNVLGGPNYSGGNVPQAVLDPTGNVFLVGGTPGANPGLYRILKIGSDGIPVWTNQNANIGATNSMIEGAAVDKAGNLYLTGDAPSLSNGSADYVAMKFSGGGQLLWSNRFDGTASGGDYPFGIGLSGAGELYLSGQSDALAGNREFATVKFADSVFYSPPRDFTGLDTITCALTDYLGNSATGTVDVLVLPGAFQFNLSSTATKMSSNGMQLRVEGAPGTNASVLEASLDALTWQPISTNAPTNGVLQFLDRSVTNLTRRFYRVAQPQ